MGDDRRRVSCGPAAFIDEGMMVAVPVIPPFLFEDDEIGKVKARGAVVARKMGRLYAYANVCRHIPLTLDLGDGDVMAVDKRHLLCHHHGALYRVEDGKCVMGPCDGSALVKLDVEVVDGELILVLPVPPKGDGVATTT